MDRISDLHKRLRSLPDELEHVYKGLFSGIKPSYFEYASQLFQISRAAGGSLSLLDSSFADEENVDFAMNGETQPLSPTDQRIRCEEMLRRLNSRCRGFLEVSSKTDSTRTKDFVSCYDLGNSDASGMSETTSTDDCEPSGRPSLELSPVQPWLSLPLPTDEGQEADAEVTAGLVVNYLHQTTTDFLESSETQMRISSATGKTFDPHLSLNGMYVLRPKIFTVDAACRTTSYSGMQRTLLTTSLWNLVTPCLLHLREAGNTARKHKTCSSTNSTL